MGAGIQPWYTFADRLIPGLGTAKVNVANGNLVIQASDVDIPAPGMPLSFTRTWNSQSLHDTAGDDGSEPALFGNGWTNEYDAHLVYHPGTTPIISVYDMDGSRSDFTGTPGGKWNAPAGDHDVLEPDPNDSTDCAYWLVKPSGVTYWFHTASDINGSGGSCGAVSGLIGRVNEIFGRNSNNVINLVYQYDTTGKSAEDITQINVNDSDGEQLQLVFAKFGKWNELANITRPDGGFLRYKYDSTGTLYEVDKPGANPGTLPPDPLGSLPVIPAGDVPETYVMSTTSVQACGPRATIATWSSKSDGACLDATLSAANVLKNWSYEGVWNFTPNDGLGAQLQTGPTTSWQLGFNTATFVFAGAVLTMTDEDGHAVAWTTGSNLAVTKRQRWTSASDILVDSATWGSDNNLKTYTDPGGNVTTTTYDTNGDVTEVDLPATGAGTGKLTFTYNKVGPNFYNLVGACDAVYNSTHAGACPSATGSAAGTVYAYSAPTTVDPHGEVTDVWTPCFSQGCNGYHEAFAYSPSAQGGTDLGLVTSITGDTITEYAPTGSMTPTQNFVYYGPGVSGAGQIHTASISNGATLVGKSTWTYDADNRTISAQDPDGLTSYRCYYPNDLVEQDQSPHQNSLDGGTVCGANSVFHVYDTDGDEAQTTSHYGNVAGITKKWYDGSDRLVEVKQPSGNQINLGFPNWQRYIYDLSQLGAGAALTMTGLSGSFVAYGNMYKTERCWNIASPPSSVTCTFADASGTSYDGVDRPINSYSLIPGTGNPATGSPDTVAKRVNTYFLGTSTPSAGLLSTVKDPAGITTTFAYDPRAEAITKSFTDSTPTQTLAYDLNGRLLTAKSSGFGTDTNTYDADGRLVSRVEGSVSGSLNSQAYNYTYYKNGWKAAMAVGATLQTTSVKFQYTYQADGNRLTLTIPGLSPFSWTYSPAGRMTSQSDPFTGSSMAAITSYYPTGGTTSLSAKKITYVDGLPATMTFPNGAKYSAMSSDAESEITGFTVAPPTGFVPWNQPGQPPTNSYVTGGAFAYDQVGQLLTTSGASVGTSGSYLPVELAPACIGSPLVGPVRTSCYTNGTTSGADYYTGDLRWQNGSG